MRTACWTCRRRTIQCDQTKIPCAKCEKAGLECFEKRPLRWVKGIAIRGKLRGSVLGVNANEAEETPSTQRNGVQILRSCAKSPPFALKDPCIHALDWSSRFYLDYCRPLMKSTFSRARADGSPKITYASLNCSFYMTARAIRFEPYLRML
jgi:hypothetical protein